MKLIKPKEISGAIMTLIEEADEKVIIISPYYNIQQWKKLLNSLSSLKRRNVDIEFYVREGEVNSINELKCQGFSAIPISNLHTKLYLNEKEAIVSSMNLNISSDTNSLDIALKTENNEEYKELYQYYNRYIKNTLSKNTEYVDDSNWLESIDKMLAKEFQIKVYIQELEGKIVINTFNRYECFIFNNKTNELRISGVLTNKEFIAANTKSYFQSTNMKIELVKGGNGNYDTIWGTVTNLKSRSINELYKEDEKNVIDSILGFIVGVEKFKKMFYQ